MEKKVIILAFYFAMKNDSLEERKIFEAKKIHLQDVTQRFSLLNVDVSIFVFPTYKGEDRIECVYPKFIVDIELHKEFENHITEFKLLVDKLGENNI